VAFGQGVEDVNQCSGTPKSHCGIAREASAADFGLQSMNV
jgi:hypothetical protein